MHALLSKDNFLLAALPVVAFVFSLAFEGGVASAYNYPYEFISIDLKVTVRAILFLILIAFPLYISARIHIYLLSSKAAVKRWLGLQLLYLLLISLVAYLTGFDKQVTIPLLFFAGILVLIHIFRFLLAASKHGAARALETIAANDGFKDIAEWKLPDSRPTIKDQLIAHTILAAAFLFALGLSSGAGKMHAQLRAQYDITTIDGTKHAILSRYSDLLVLGTIKENKFGHEIKVISIYDPRLGTIQRKRIENFLDKNFEITRSDEK